MDRQASERQPLLPPEPGPGLVEYSSDTSYEKHSKRPWHTPRGITHILFLVLILVSFGDQLAQSPQTRIFESVICYRYYEKADPSRIRLSRDAVGPGAIGGVDEKWCKVNAVQDELATLSGYLQMFESIPNLLLAVPFGWCADRFGRWPFLFLNLFQFVLRTSFVQLVTWFWQRVEVKAVWVSALFSILGGGPAVASALFFVVLSDVTPEADRAAVFLRGGAANLSANFFMPPLAAWLMTIDPWIPFLGSTILSASAAFMYLMVPETLDYRHPFLPSTSHPPSPVAGPTDITTTTSSSSTSSPPGSSTNFITRWTYEIKEATAFLRNDWRVPALIAPFCGHMLLVAAGGPLLLQYASKRYALSFSEGTLLITIRNGVNVILLILIIPYLSTYLIKSHGLSDQRKDLYLARASQLLTALGLTFLAASPTWPFSVAGLTIASFGQGAMLLVRSFMTSLVPAHHIARVYSIISMWDSLGTMLGAPLLARLFKRGMGLGGGWVGLPFYFLGLGSMVFAVLLFGVRLKRGEDGYKGVDSDSYSDAIRDG